eukprot:TRINITY_DN17554_c0_g1_i1.p1 TRINITY_DN17554_c0_g1~~TRINITY_DN17554_c0_g1_i1.p1  ORF type:complete len:281 (+),score=53.69 TRINITY_DN17554_c0_g1_i1:72-914(+)
MSYPPPYGYPQQTGYTPAPYPVQPQIVYTATAPAAYPAQAYPQVSYPAQGGYAAYPQQQTAYYPAAQGYTPAYPAATGYPATSYPVQSYPAQPYPTAYPTATYPTATYPTATYPTGTVPMGYAYQPQKITYEMTLSARALDRKDVFSKSDPFVCLFSIARTGYLAPKQNKKKSGRLAGKIHGAGIPVYKSETITDNQNPAWKTFTVDATTLCGGNIDAPFLVEVYDWDRNGAHDFIGRAETTLRELSVMKELQIKNPRKMSRPLYYNSGVITVDKCQRLT